MIKLVKRKLLFNEIINNKCYNVNRIYKNFVVFDKSC